MKKLNLDLVPEFDTNSTNLDDVSFRTDLQRGDLILFKGSDEIYSFYGDGKVPGVVVAAPLSSPDERIDLVAKDFRCISPEELASEMPGKYLAEDSVAITKSEFVKRDDDIIYMTIEYLDKGLNIQTKGLKLGPYIGFSTLKPFSNQRLLPLFLPYEGETYLAKKYRIQRGSKVIKALIEKNGEELWAPLPVYSSGIEVTPAGRRLELPTPLVEVVE